MTSKLVVNTIEADTGISSVSFASSISMNSTSKFHFSNAGIDIGADTNINRPTAGVLGFNINSSEKVRITSGGFLGIGAGANTNKPLHIYTGSSDSEIRLQTNSGTEQNSYMSLRHSTGDLDFYTVQSGTNMKFHTVNTERLRINSSGQLIMTNAATQTFSDFSTTNNSTRGIISVAGKDSSGNAVTVKIGGFGDTSRGEIFTHSNHGLGFATNNAATQMVLGTNGCLSIGKTGSAGKAIEIYQASFAALRIQNSSTGTGNNDGILLEASGSDALLYNYESANLKLGTAGLERLRIDSSGALTSTASNNGQIIHYLKNVDTTASSSAMTVEQHFNFERTGGGLNLSAARIIAGKEREWVGAAANQDGYFAIHTTQNETSTEKLRIHANGAVTKPQTPAFMAYGGSGSISAGNYIVFTQENYDTQNNYNTSNGIFTAPIAGKYLFTITGLYTNNSSTPPHKYVWHINNANSGVLAEWQDGSISNSYNTIGNSSVIYQLAVNDTVRIYVEAGNAHISGGQTKYCGYLLG